MISAPHRPVRPGVGNLRPCGSKRAHVFGIRQPTISRLHESLSPGVPRLAYLSAALANDAARWTRSLRTMVPIVQDRCWAFRAVNARREEPSPHRFAFHLYYLDSPRLCATSHATVPVVTNDVVLIQACDTCRSRKQKCDEQRPKCGTCQKFKLECHYREPVPTKYAPTLT